MMRKSRKHLRVASLLAPSIWTLSPLLLLASGGALALTLSEKAKEVGCVSSPLAVGVSTYRCAIQTGAFSYFTFVNPTGEGETKTDAKRTNSDNSNHSQSRLPKNADGPVVLLCAITINGQRLAKNLTIDYVRQTVNGLPAQFDETMITWSTQDFDNRTRQNVTNRHELNRVAATYQIWEGGGTIYGAGGPLSYGCEKAPAAKF